jgi:hypothetical protein
MTMAGVSLYVTGPVFVSTGTATGNGLVYFGTYEGECQVNLALAEEDVRIDLSGPAIPFDVQMMGEVATISGVMTRIDDAEFQKHLSRFPNFTGIGMTGKLPDNTTTDTRVAGALPFQGLGSLYVTEGNSVPLNLYFPYNTKTVFNGGGTPSAMISSMNFPVAWMTGAVPISAGTRVRRQQITFRAIPQFTVNQKGSAYYLWTQTAPGGGVLATFN